MPSAPPLAGLTRPLILSRSTTISAANCPWLTGTAKAASKRAADANRDQSRPRKAGDDVTGDQAIARLHKDANDLRGMERVLHAHAGESA